MVDKQKPLVEQVFEYIKSRGDQGATDSEIQEALGIGGDTQRPRRVSLVNKGTVIDSGKTRKTTKGRNAAVWVVK